MKKTVLACLFLAALMAGCQESEQDRPLSLEKGTYEGQPDTPLDERRINDLRDRNQLQRF